MKYICPGVGCGALYEVGPEQYGTLITCRECGVLVMAEAKGLRLASREEAGRGQTAPRESTPPILSEASGSPTLATFNPQRDRPFHNGTTYDYATWLFGLGAVFIIFFLFNPIIDQAKLWYRNSLVRAGDEKERRLDEELQRKFRKEDRQDQKAERKRLEEERMRPVPTTPKERDARLAEDKVRQEERDKERQSKLKVRETQQEDRDRAKESWEEKKAKIQAEREDIETRSSLFGYWYAWGMMFGFLFLAIASINYLRPSQTLTRRIVGSIVICAQILFIFLSFVVFGSRVR